MTIFSAIKTCHDIAPPSQLAPPSVCTTAPHLCSAERISSKNRISALCALFFQCDQIIGQRQIFNGVCKELHRSALSPHPSLLRITETCTDGAHELWCAAPDNELPHAGNRRTQRFAACVEKQHETWLLHGIVFCGMFRSWRSSAPRARPNCGRPS